MRGALLTVFGLFLFSSCQKEDNSNEIHDTAYKQKMRDFVIGISQYAKTIHPGFNIVPQNGIELVSSNGEVEGLPDAAYINAIDANGQEDLFYGYDADDQATPTDVTEYLIALLNVSKQAGHPILVTDYCSSTSRITQSYLDNHNNDYVSFAADERELNTIPGFPIPINHENTNSVTLLAQVQNFLYLINPSHFSNKTDFIKAVTATNYDLLIMDLFFQDDSIFTASELKELKNKANGGKRLVLSYMSIGEAENYRYYWQPGWSVHNPSWLDAENDQWSGNYKVKYWDPEWQGIMYGNDQSYLKKILDAGFDGVYLDLIDAFEYYE